MIRVKICGITNLEDALAAESLGADALGFIFTEKSPRCLELKKAKKIISSLGPFVVKAGVFMDQSKEEVLNTASFLGLDLLQFHGNESFAYCNSFQPAFKAIKVCFPEQLSKAIVRYRRLGTLMFDIPYDQKKKGLRYLPEHALSLIKNEIRKKEKVIISGGLDCANIEKAIKIRPYGVDVCSGIEKRAGKKDKKLMKDFIGKVKNAFT